MVLTAAAPDLIHCGTSPHFLNKENRAPELRLCKQHTAIARREDPAAAPVYDKCWAFSRFPTTRLEEKAYVERILNGLAWIPATFGGDGRRTNENWQQSELAGLDFDANVSVADCLAVPFIRKHALLVHPSASSGKLDEHGQPVYKTRVVFRLDQPITNLEDYRTVVKALGRIIGLPEDACSYKPAQPFYGSTNRIEQPYINYGARLPRAILDTEIDAMRAESEHRRSVEALRRAELNYQPVAKDSGRVARRIAQKLQRAYDRLVAATSDRTTAAFGKARYLARYLAYWPITEQDIERTILDALRANGAAQKYSEIECLRHIGNGIRAGLHDAPEPLELPAPARTKRTAQTSAPVKELTEPDLVEFARTLNKHAVTGEPILHRIACAGRAAGIFPMIDEPVNTTRAQWRAARDASGMTVSDKTLDRYLNTAWTISAPIANTEGADFVLHARKQVIAELKRLEAAAIYMACFPSKERIRVDAVTGAVRTIEPIPADLSASALQAVGLESQEALLMAGVIKSQHYEAADARKRHDAAERVRWRYEEFCDRLDNDRLVIRLSGEGIANEGDLKRRQLRAWHEAGLERFSTTAEQMRSLGVSESTLKKMLDDAGVERSENFEYVEVAPGDVVAQVRSTMNRLKARPIKYRFTDNDGVADERPYDKEAIVADMAYGRVEVIYQTANVHTVVDLPLERRHRHAELPASSRGAAPVRRPLKVERTGYRYSWVYEQLQLIYQRKHRQAAPPGMTARELIAAVVSDPLIDMGLSLGGVVIEHQEALA